MGCLLRFRQRARTVGRIAPVAILHLAIQPRPCQARPVRIGKYCTLPIVLLFSAETLSEFFRRQLIMDTTNLFPLQARYMLIHLLVGQPHLAERARP
jgi:hypothetical protein